MMKRVRSWPRDWNRKVLYFKRGKGNECWNRNVWVIKDSNLVFKAVDRETEVAPQRKELSRDRDGKRSLEIHCCPGS